MAPLRVSEPSSLQWKANPHGKKWPSRYSGHHCKNFIAEHNWNCSKAVGTQFGSFTWKKKRYTVVYFCKFGFTEFLHYLHSAHVSVTIVISYSFFTMFQTIQKIFSESTWWPQCSPAHPSASSQSGNPNSSRLTWKPSLEAKKKKRKG